MSATPFSRAVLLLVALGLAGPASAAAPPDAWITTKVKIALLTASEVSAVPVHVDTLEGNVTLYGEVGSEAERERAGTVAQGVEGVAGVRNLLVVVPAKTPPEVPDAQLREQIETVLTRDKALEGSDVEVESVTQGVVLLRGETDTLSAHRRALEDVRSVAGVRQVASEITSPDRLGDRELWASDEEVAGSTASGTDSGFVDGWITAKTKVALMANDAVPALDVNVDTRGGEVTLFGIVGSEAAKEAAGAEASKRKGVTAVHNELQVVAEAQKPAVEASDERVASDVEERLGSRADLEGTSIDVSVAAGVVRLTGAVDSQAQRLEAITVARSTDGVKSAVDDLEIRPDVAAK